MEIGNNKIVTIVLCGLAGITVIASVSTLILCCSTKDAWGIVDGNTSSEQESKKALNMAKAEKARGNEKNAILYALNALNHSFKNFETLQFYFDMVKDNPDPETQQQLAGILAIAVYQVSADKLADVIAMKESNDKKLTEADVPQENTDEEEQPQMTEEEQKQQKSKLHEEYSVMPMEELASIIRTLNGLTENGKEWAKKELEFATKSYSVRTILTSVQNAVVKAEFITDNPNACNTRESDLVAARNQLTTAGTMLSQIWIIDCSDIGILLNEAKELQEKIGNTDTKINRIASQPALDEINRLLVEVEGITLKDMYSPTGTKAKGECTLAIETVGEKANEIQAQFARVLIPDAEKKQQLKRIEKTVSEKLGALTKRRYISYQKWALQILEAGKERMEGDYDALWTYSAIFQRKDYDRINPDNLSSGLRDLYHAMAEKLFSDMKKSEQVDKKLYTARTYTAELENF